MKLGALVWPQYTDLDSLRDTGALVDRLGYDSLWTWDHLYPIVGDPEGPMFEGYLTLAAWAENTEQVQLGLMVGANTFRNPALVVKMVTTLDHMSGGQDEARHRRGVVRDGAHRVRDRFRLGLRRAPRLVRRVGRVDAGDAARRPGVGPWPFYAAKEVVNNPPPVQDHLPILIGGSGERKTLATVARYADAWNTGGDLERVRHKDEVLRRWCDEVGRDESEIERTLRT